VFLRNTPAKANTGVDPHAQNVAGLMISSDKALRGVAPAAALFSCRWFAQNRRSTRRVLSAQHVALQNGRDVRAINFSFGETLSATRDQMHFRWQCLANAVY